MRLTILTWTVVFATSALAQEPPEGAPDAGRVPLAPTAASATSWEPPRAYVAPSPEPVSARSRVEGASAFGFLGTSPVLRAMTATGPDGQRTDYTSVPLLGWRSWLKGRAVGLEFGLGAMVAGAAWSQGGFGSPQFGPATAELLGHAGLPVALASTPNTIVFIAPEVRVGYSHYGEGLNALSATTLLLGARAGIEIFFGGLGLPNLSLDAGVRVGLTHEWRASTSQSVGAGPFTSTASQTRFETSLVASPWDLFTSSIAAHYYF